MKQVDFKITENRPIANLVYLMKLEGDASAITAPGQFINLTIDGFYLRRPISVCDWRENEVTIIYKVVGNGTEVMSRMQVGETLNALVGLGNGFDVNAAGDRPLLVGGGVGVPPMYGLCKKLVAAGKKPQVVLGFNSASDVFYEEEFKALGAEVYVTTADGSYGTKGFVTTVIPTLAYSYFYTCGPEPMFRAMSTVMQSSGEYSFEERMGCGFGACMGCSCKTLTGYKRICKEGPVMKKEEILWER